MRSLIADRRLLFLLDNARTAEQVRPLLPGGDRCLVIVTSRNQLRGLKVLNDAGMVELDTLAAERCSAFPGPARGHGVPG